MAQSAPKAARRSLNPRAGGRFRAAAFVAIAAGSTAGVAGAGPPYTTDDPEPTPAGGWENYVFVTGVAKPGETAGQTGLELNYGGAQDLQLSLSVPLDYDDRHALRAGGGDVDLGVKYRLLHPPANSWLPDAAIFPSLTLPTGSRAFDTGHPTFFLPLWLEKDLGKWSIFGGGGYQVNPGGNQRNFALVGWAATYSFSERLNLGVEIYHQTPASIGGPALTNLGFGAIYQMTDHWAVMASGGPGLQTPSRSGSSAFYASLQFTN